MKLVLFFGPPGSGKGTQANLLLQNNKNLAYLATGDIIRKHIKQKTEIGKIAQQYIDQGLLVPSNIINQLLNYEITKLENNINTIILDGYPRTIDQLFYLINEFSNPYLTIFFDISLEKIIERVSYRRICPKCNAIYHLIYKKPNNDQICDNCQTNLIQRSDDKEEVVTKRYQVYLSETLPVIQQIEKLNLKIVRIDSSKPIYQVFREIVVYF